MNIKEKIKLVGDLVKHYQELNKNFDRLDALFGTTSDSKFFNSVWLAFDSYCITVEKAIGDTTEAVNWFIFENKCGKAGMTCEWNGKKFKMKSVTDLVKFIELTDATN